MFGQGKELVPMKSFVSIQCTADVLPNTVVVSHSYIVLLSVGGVIVAQEFVVVWFRVLCF